VHATTRQLGSRLMSLPLDVSW